MLSPIHLLRHKEKPQGESSHSILITYFNLVQSDLWSNDILQHDQRYVLIRLQKLIASSMKIAELEKHCKDLPVHEHEYVPLCLKYHQHEIYYTLIVLFLRIIQQHYKVFKYLEIMPHTMPGSKSRSINMLQVDHGHQLWQIIEKNFVELAYQHQTNNLASMNKLYEVEICPYFWLMMSHLDGVVLLYVRNSKS